MTPAILEEALTKVQRDDPTAGDLEAIDRLLSQVGRQQQMTSLAISKLDDAQAMASLLATLEQLGRQRAGLEVERERIGQRRAIWEEAQTRLGDLKAWCARVGERLEAGSLDYETRRSGLDEFGIQAVVEPGGHYEFRTGIPLIASRTG